MYDKKKDLEGKKCKSERLKMSRKFRSETLVDETFEKWVHFCPRVCDTRSRETYRKIK